MEPKSRPEGLSDEDTSDRLIDPANLTHLGQEKAPTEMDEAGRTIP